MSIFTASFDAVFPSTRLAIVTFHPDIWDVYISSRRPKNPISLLPRFVLDLGLTTTLIEDAAITVPAWEAIIRRGPSVLCNMSHGDLTKDGNVVIMVGNDSRGKPTDFFGAARVTAMGAHLPGGLLYNYSCYSLANFTLADAFLASGLSTYIGWNAPTSAKPDRIDQVDGAFWASMPDRHTSVRRPYGCYNSLCTMPTER